MHDPDRYEVDGTLQPGSVFTIAKDGSLEWLTRSPREIQEIEAGMRAVRAF